MKHSIKYADGYIHIDDNNLYLNASAKPEVTGTLTEKTSESAAADKRRSKTNTTVIIALFVVSMAVVVYGVAKGNIKFGFLMLIYVGLFFVFRYLQRQMGSRYKIPLSKIDAVEPHGDGIKISFRNADNQSDFEIVKGVKEEDRQILASLLQ